MMMGNKVQGIRFKDQGFKKTMGCIQKVRVSIAVTCILICMFCLSPSTFHLSPAACYAVEYSMTEAKIVHFIKEIYNDSDDIQVRLNTIPNQLKENVRVKNMNFKKVPDANGDGICMVEIIAGAGRNKNIQVPFRVFTKRKLFVLTINGKKDQVIRKGDLSIRETYMNGKGYEYPSSVEDLTGKVLKRDIPASTVITYQMVEDSIAVQRGDIVDIIAESKKILVSAKGKIIDKGRMGDTVRVKNISSGKEILGRVVAHNTVAVDF
jgi:flagellar basal body P-ring formation protein FlgA